MRAHALDERQERTRQEIERRRRRLCVPPEIRDRARAGRRQQRGAGRSATPACSCRRCRSRTSSRRRVACRVERRAYCEPSFAPVDGRRPQICRRGLHRREVLAHAGRASRGCARMCSMRNGLARADGRATSAERKICPPPSPSEPSISIIASTLHAHDLLQRVDDLDEVAPAPPSPRRCPCRPPASRRSRPRPCGTRRPRSPRRARRP